MSNIWYEVYTSCEEDGTETVFTAEDINDGRRECSDEVYQEVELKLENLEPKRTRISKRSPQPCQVVEPERYASEETVAAFFPGLEVFDD